MSAGSWPRIDYSELSRFVIAIALTILIAFSAWEAIGRLLVDSDEGLLAVRYAAVVSTSILVAIVVYVISLRRARDRQSQMQSALHSAVAELRSAESVLDAVLESSPAAVLVIDRERRLLRANRMAEQVHGKHEIGHVFSPDTGRCQICTGCDTLEQGVSLVAQGELTDPGTGAVLALSSHPFKLADGTTAAVIVEEIITKQKKLQASLVHQEKMAAFGLVAAGVAHEMGNPLSSIEMHLQLLDEGGMNEDDAESIATLRKETARLRRTLRELVDFARRRRTTVSSVSVESVIRDALQLLRYDPRMRNVETTVDAGPEIPAVAIVEDHLMQVLVNLLINAIDAMPDGGHLRIDSRHVGDQVAIRVLDDGAGMSKATRERCFEPLFTTKEPGKGTGLGLSICRDVLATAGGHIELHSAPGRGTTVVVTLPEEAPEPLVQIGSAAPAAATAEASSPRAV